MDIYIAITTEQEICEQGDAEIFKGSRQVVEVGNWG